MKIFSGNANPDLAREIAAYLGTQVGDAVINRFNNGEVQVMINESVRGKDVFAVSYTHLFPAGMRLTELQLADEMGVSRTPIREAIRNLEQEGLVVMIPRRGAYVADVSIHDINEVYEIRTALETLAAGLAAERIEDSEIEEMDKYLIATRTYVSRLDYAKIVEMDTAFHDVIYKASRNKRCMNIISTLRQQITSIRERSMPYPGRLDEMLLEHRAIVDAIAQRDVEKAQMAVKTHMENAERTLLRVIEEQHLVPVSYTHLVLFYHVFMYFDRWTF